MTQTALFKAMAKAFPKIEGALKDSKNPHFKTTYADLSSVVSAIKPALSENGMFFAQITHEQAGGVCVETIVCHETGEQMSFGRLFVPAGKSDAQGYGSALTYARRYSLMTAFGVCPEDDDGNAAAKAPPVAKSEPEEMPDHAFAKLQQLAQATGVTSQALCKKYNTDNLRTLPRSLYDDCISFLEDRLAEKAKVESGKSLAEELGDDIGF